MNESERGTEAGASRRSVLKAAAWATPVVVMMTTAPLAAATTGVTATLVPPLPDVAEAGDTLSLVFTVTGAAEGTQAIAEITSGYPAVADWDTDAVAYSRVEEDGNVYLFATVRASGSFTVTLTIADFIGNFPVTVTVV